MRDVIIAGVGMHKLGKYLELRHGDLAQVAVWNAIRDAGVGLKDIQFAAVGTMMGGTSVFGQKILRNSGISEIPIINVEGACATGALALHEAWLAVGSGQYDVALALGVEKMFSGEKGAGLDLGEGDSEGVEITGNNPMHEAVHCASLVKGVMDKYGWTQEHFAKLEAKNKFNGSLNPNAQHQKAYTPEEIAGSRLLSWPITLYMCAPIGDGAAAAIICSKEAAKKLGVKKPHIHIASMAMRSPRVVDPREDEPRPEEIIRGDNVWYTMHEAYEKAGIGPEDVELVELHSPVTPLEMIRWHYLGICPAEDAAKWVEEGNAALNGKVPVNTSGGSTTRGHAIGATGVAQTAEIVWQLRGEAGKRQIEGRSGKGPKVGVVQNSGGFVDTTGQACSIGIVMKR